MGRQQLVVFAIAAISAFLGTAFLSGWFSGSKMIQGVAVAQTDINVHTFIEQSQVTTGSVEGGTYQPGILLRPNQAFGRIPRVRIHQGEPITAGMLYSGTAGLEHVIPEGYRAMSLPIKQPERELKLFNAGSRIDIIATIQERRGFVRTGIILEDVLLLAKETVGVGKGGPISFIVAVDPKGAEKLALAISRGELRVTLRRGQDDAIVDSTGTGLEDLIRGMAPSDRSVELFSDVKTPDSMEIIRGTRRTTDYFEEGALSKASARLVQQK